MYVKIHVKNSIEYLHKFLNISCMDSVVAEITSEVEGLSELVAVSVDVE